MRRCGVELGMKTEYRFPQGDGFREVIVITEVKGTPEARSAAIAALQAFLAPAPQCDLELWLAELSVMVARRPDDDATETLRLRAYTDRLGAYPADVVREALLVRTWRFWPSWAELKEVCDQLVRNRRAIIGEIEAETWREAQRAREQVSREEWMARQEAERAKRQAERAACLSDAGCDDCIMPEVCAAHRRRAASGSAA